MARLEVSVSVRVGGVEVVSVEDLVPRALTALRGSPAVERLVGAMMFSLWRPFPKPIYLYGDSPDKVMAAFALAELGGRPWSELRADGIPFEMRKGEWFVIEHPMVLEDLVPAHRPTLLKRELRTIITGDRAMLPDFRDRVFSLELSPDLERSQYSAIVSGETAHARVELGRRIREWMRGAGAPSMDDYLDMWVGLHRVPETDRSSVAACRFGLRLLDQFLDAHQMPFDAWPWTRESPRPPSTSDAPEPRARPGGQVERSATRRPARQATTAVERRAKPARASASSTTAAADPHLVDALVGSVRHAIDEGRAHVYDSHGSFSEESAKSGRRVGILTNGRLLLLCAPARTLLAADLAVDERPSLPQLSAALELVGLVEKDEAGRLTRSHVHEGKTVKVWDVAPDEFWSYDSDDPRAHS